MDNVAYSLEISLAGRSDIDSGDLELSTVGSSASSRCRSFRSDIVYDSLRNRRCIGNGSQSGESECGVHVDG